MICSLALPLILMVFVLSVLILSPSLDETASSLVVFVCIWVRVCARSAKSSAKSRSSSCFTRDHWISFLQPVVVSFIIQSTARRKRNGDRRQPCLTPDSILKLSVKVAQNSFQHFPRRRFRWVIIATLYQLMLQSWYQKTAQSLVNLLVLFSWHNRLP